jgi:hypothetical protein
MDLTDFAQVVVSEANRVRTRGASIFAPELSRDAWAAQWLGAGDRGDRERRVEAGALGRLSPGHPSDGISGLSWTPEKS